LPVEINCKTLFLPLAEQNCSHFLNKSTFEFKGVLGFWGFGVLGFWGKKKEEPEMLKALNESSTELCQSSLLKS